MRPHRRIRCRRIDITSSVVWAADLTGEGPFGLLVRSPILAAALDEVCGKSGWIPRGAVGQVPVRFPVQSPADDRGWHIDRNTPLVDGSGAVSGQPSTMLLLTLLSDVGVNEVPPSVG